MSETPRGVGVRVPPTADPNRTMRTLDTLVRRVAIPVALRTSRSRHPIGQVDRDLRAVVSRITVAGEGVKVFELSRADCKQFPWWFPGAHIDVVLPSGKVRQYSLNGRRDNPNQWRIAVRRIPLEAGGGGGSIEMHELEVGDALVVRGPREAFPFVFNEAGYLFVAGGIGITPILPMLRRTARRNRVPWTLVYTGRTRDSMPFLDEIAEIAGARPGNAERIHVWPDDEYGTPDAAKIISLAPAGAALYTCGPTPMIDALRRAIPDPQIDALHYERFSPPPVVAGKPFRIRLEREGVDLPVRADETALTAVRRVHPGQAYSCQQGFCGTCKVRVLEGTVEHRDRKLTDYEREGHMLLCVSRGSGTVVLDV
ncbi:PDR/VanB family oxidoreductase [Nocardioides sp. Kera G14]|uniref:PDR/VanB family oxidoreductase n=1 Tax=Nocardioides sp. Kera G14 TaxID=2884264 RepID=UPI001D102384|nr:PDR/VanB family oxidoreductase [Nocardioides sp. Kera G14]UDY23567.1 PDR/VanB family oxidoreductase [Nocardioides sp. Kera G14]